LCDLSLCHTLARLPKLTRKNDAYYYQKEQCGKAKNNQAEVHWQENHRKTPSYDLLYTVSHTKLDVKRFCKDLTVQIHKHA
jgi:hypothetical protein